MKLALSFSLVAIVFAGVADAQRTQMPIPGFQSTYSSPSRTRGFYFQAPHDLVIRGLRVPDESNHGTQNLEVLLLAAAPPLYPNSVTGESVLYAANRDSAEIVPAAIFVAAGQWVGVLGACGTSTMHTSYAAAGPFTSELLDTPVTLARLITQTNLNTSGGGQPVSAEPTLEIGRVEVWVEPARPRVPLPAFSYTYSGPYNTRGFYFQAPKAFRISGLRVPDETGHGTQNVEVFLRGSAPPVYPATDTAGAVFYAANVPSAEIIPTCIDVAAGQWVCVLGACGTTTMLNSYGPYGPSTTNVLGTRVTIDRFLTQSNLRTSGGGQPYSAHPGYEIGRVELYVEPVEHAGLPPFVRTYTGSYTRGYYFQTPIPFEICGLRVPDESAAGTQSVEVFLRSSPPPAFPATDTAGSVFYATDEPSCRIIPACIPVEAGQWVCVLGACGTTSMCNSYGSPGPVTTNLLGTPITIDRLITQTNLHTSGGGQPYATDPGFEIGRIELYVADVAAVGIPSFDSTYSSANLTRGFFFQAPIAFEITGLRVPDEIGSGIQNVEVLLSPTPFPVFSASGTATTAFYAANQPSNQVIPASVVVQPGQWVGILGACGTTTMHNSYGEYGPFESTILGVPVTIDRFITQTNLNTSGGGQPVSASVGAVGRVVVHVAHFGDFAEATAYGAGCAGMTLTPEARPIIAGPPATALLSGIPAAALGRPGAYLMGLTKYQPGLPLSIVGMPGCELLTDGGLTSFPFFVTGPTDAHLSVPIFGAVHDLHVYVQAFVISPGSTPFGVVASNAIAWRCDFE